MQRPIEKPVGTPVEELDTPALILDLERLGANVAGFRGPARAAAWVHKTPAIALRQVAHPAVTGIAVRSVAEAEVFAAAGFEDIRVLRPQVTEVGRRRVAALTRSVRVIFEEDAPLWGEDALVGAVTVSTRVSGVPQAGRAITDCGQKAVGRDFGDPSVLGHAERTVHVGSAEHGIVAFPPGQRPLATGDWLQLVPADLATVFALHDFVHAVRGGVLEAVWPVSARGAF